MELAGGCQCGATRYRVDGVVQEANICWCRMCQRAAGAPFMTFFRVRSGQVTWRGEPTIFASSTLVERGFCKACGTPLTYRWTAGPNISLTLYSLDTPDALTPSASFETEMRPDWCRTLDRLAERAFDVTGRPGFVSHQYGDVRHG